jgi:multiple sugar transport system substrate-binding protein
MISTMRSRGQRYNEILADADAHVDKSWQWIPTTSETYQHLNDGLSAAVPGDGTFVDAVAAAQEQTMTTLRARVSRSRANKGASR